jgi:hypothetical protein
VVEVGLNRPQGVRMNPFHSLPLGGFPRLEGLDAGVLATREFAVESILTPWGQNRAVLCPQGVRITGRIGMEFVFQQV